MSDSDEQDMVPRFTPREVRLADVLFIAIRKHLMVFKDLTASRHVHYTMVMNGPLINFHKTLEDQDKHLHFIEIEFDWQYLMKRIDQEMANNRSPIFQVVKTNDVEWSDLEVGFMPIQVADELFSGLTKGARLNVDEKFVDKLEKSVTHSRLGDLSNRGFIIGTGSGYLVISNGAECLLINTDKMDKLFEKSFEASIRKIHLRHFTPRLLFACLRIRLLVLRNSAIRHLRRSTVPV
jgi:hypothetical protein